MLDIDVSGDGTSLTLTTRASGSSQKLSIQGTEDDTAEVTYGKDAVISMVDGFSDDAVATSDGKNVTIEDSSGFKMQLAVEDTAGEGDQVDVVVYDTGSMILQIGANEHQNVAIDFPEVSCRTLQLKESDGTSLINVCSQEGATKAITSFDNAIRAVSETRSQLGAYENRLESTVSSLDVSSENMTDSMSRIMDTDMAEAMTNYTQENVLSQAATTMLAQANNRPQQILSLLQG
jgi:flagellin